VDEPLRTDPNSPETALFPAGHGGDSPPESPHEAATLLPSPAPRSGPPTTEAPTILPAPSSQASEAETVWPGAHAPTATEPTADGSDRDGTVCYFSDYLLERELARGGMGVVYKARQVDLNRTVALKMILAGQLATEADIRRFYLEAEAAAGLEHPGIVPIYEVGQHEGQHYFSMGFIEGESLAQRVAAGPLSPRQAAMLLREVSEAVQFAHDRGVIHRDIKPANILIDAQGRPKVTDFGLAKKLQGGNGLTASGQIMGTPSYMPPEQASGQPDAVGPPADVYALGATLFCLVTGRPPFQAATAMDTLLQVLGDEPVPPRRLNPSVPPDLETICLKCLEKEPSRRYASAGALAEDLARWLGGEPILARPTGRLERLIKWARRRPTAAALILVITAAVVGAAALGAHDLRRSRETIAIVSKERNEAKKSEERAIAKEKEALSARDEARREAAANLRRLVRSALSDGDRLLDEGQPFLALPWYVHALKNDPDGPGAEHRHRVRIANVLASLPRLTRLDQSAYNTVRPGPAGPLRAPQGSAGDPTDQEPRREARADDHGAGAGFALRQPGAAEGDGDHLGRRDRPAGVPRAHAPLSGRRRPVPRRGATVPDRDGDPGLEEASGR
jgi:tRNA A-37 threonylcarbamoyl transferase component Bud32